MTEPSEEAKRREDIYTALVTAYKRSGTLDNFVSTVQKFTDMDAETLTVIWQVTDAFAWVGEDGE